MYSRDAASIGGRDRKKRRLLANVMRGVSRKEKANSAHCRTAVFQELHCFRDRFRSETSKQRKVILIPSKDVDHNLLETTKRLRKSNI